MADVKIEVGQVWRDPRDGERFSVSEVRDGVAHGSSMCTSGYGSRESREFHVLLSCFTLVERPGWRWRVPDILDALADEPSNGLTGADRRQCATFASDMRAHKCSISHALWWAWCALPESLEAKDTEAYLVAAARRLGLPQTVPPEGRS